MKNSIYNLSFMLAACSVFASNLAAQVVVTTQRVPGSQTAPLPTNGTFNFPPVTNQIPVPSNSSTDLANGKLFTLLANVANPNGPISNLTNGLAQTNQDSVAESFFANSNISGGTANLRIQLDLESLHSIQSINTYSWHLSSRAPQFYRVYGAANPTNSAPNFTDAAFQNDAALTSLGYTRIATVSTATGGGQHGVTITGTIGQHRYLLFDLAPPSTSQGPRPTFYGEIDVYGTPASPPTFPLTITPAVSPQTGFDLRWESKAAKSYNLRTSADLASPINQWQLIAQNIPHTQPQNLYNVPQTDPRRFYAVEEVPALPLLQSNFETDNSGFSVATSSGTSWQYGTPSSGSSASPNLGGFVSAGNGNSLRCWGTNIGNPGFYNPSSVTRLRSPVIDLRNAVGATLQFAQAVDLNEDDSAVVNIINATTDAVIASAIFTATDSNINKADWATVSPISLAAGIGQQVRLEWFFTAGLSTDYMGWYIDDVTILETATAP